MKDSFQDIGRKCFPVLGILTAIGLAGYGLCYLIVMPKVSPDRFIPKAIEATTTNPSWFGPALAVFILIYAFAFLPVAVMFIIKKYRVNPYAMVFSGCILVVSLLIEIVNNLPALVTGLYTGKMAAISPDVFLYIKQVDTLRYLSFDVAGFSLAYIALFIVVLVYFKEHKLLAYTVFVSVILILASVPCLRIAPTMAVICLALSVFGLAPMPVFLAKKAIE